ncbi:zinc-dependent metalloprotease [Kitasatospora sp. NPDC091257]|uniref:zinc-dependent metalloprotease n=1 Tax=Kitasatospora sp. NPDC091257 TaxID=3364084 RepID=UPI0038283FD2
MKTTLRFRPGLLRGPQLRRARRPRGIRTPTKAVGPPQRLAGHDPCSPLPETIANATPPEEPRPRDNRPTTERSTMFTIHNDANATADDQRRYERLMEAAIPLAADLSQLPLPDRITVRIATPQQFVAWQVEHYKLIIGRGVDSLGLGGVKRRLLKTTATMVGTSKGRAMTAKYAPMVQGAIIWRSEGPALVVMPDSHAESRGTDRLVTCCLAHEITHLAQFELNPALAYAVMRFGLQDKKAAHDERRAPAAVIEGHASWVQARASERLCGIATRDRLDDEPEPSELFTRLTAESPRTDAYDLGEKFIAAVYNHGGFQLIERLLKDEDLMPTNREIQDPAIWLDRHQDV